MSFVYRKALLHFIMWLWQGPSDVSQWSFQNMCPSPLTFSEGIGTSSLSWKLSMTSKDYFLKTILNLYKTRIFNGERKQGIIVWFLLLSCLQLKKSACIFLQVYYLFLLQNWFFLLTAWYLTDFKNDFKVFKMFNGSI